MNRNYKLYSSLTELEQGKTWAEIDLDALGSNYRLLRDRVQERNGAVRLIAVIKADAYGHGAPACVRTLLAQGCDFFAASSVDEAVAARGVCDEEQKSADVLVLGYTPPSLAAVLAEFHITQTLLSEEYALRLEQAAAAANVTLRVHVSLDTGMNRIGFAAHSEEEIRETVEAIARVSTLPHLRIEGMFTHFARADEKSGGEGDARCDLQVKRYRAVSSALEARGIHIAFHHVCNSAATLRRFADYFDGVRVGILLYGGRSSDQLRLPLKSVMRLRTVISHLNQLLPGEAVGYGGTYTADTERTIAVLPIGYADGFLRAYSGAFVTVETSQGPRRAEIVGRICMDQCMIDVTGIGAQVGDAVTLFGNSPDELHAYAERASTIDYECLCLISSRVMRKYLPARPLDKELTEE